MCVYRRWCWPSRRVDSALDSHASSWTLDPYVVYASVLQSLLLQATNAHFFIAVQWCEVAIVDRLDDVLSFGMLFYPAVHGLQHEDQGQWAMDQQVTVAFDIAGVVGIEVDEMGVEGEGGEAE